MKLPVTMRHTGRHKSLIALQEGCKENEAERSRKVEFRKAEFRKVEFRKAELLVEGEAYKAACTLAFYIIKVSISQVVLLNP